MKHEGALRPRAEVNKCHASRVRNITSLYPEGIATIVTIAMNHVKKDSYPKEPSEIGEKPSWQNERLALWGCGSPPSANEEA